MSSYFAPMRVDSGSVLALDMQSLFLSGRILPFGAKLTVTHVFRSREKGPVEAVYCFPLPRDASLISFEIKGEGFSVSSRLKRAAHAQQCYEQALIQGSLAAYTQQNADGLVNLTVGNLRPGETVAVHLNLISGLSLRDSGSRLRFPFTVAPCYHSQLRALLTSSDVALMQLPKHVTNDVFLPPIHRDASPLHTIGFELRLEPGQDIREISSPSHTLLMQLDGTGRVGVKLSADVDVPNRDLILDIEHDSPAGAAWSEPASAGRKPFAVVVPSKQFGLPAVSDRKIVFVVDCSGSMQGPPLARALKSIENCLGKMSLRDQFGIVAFATNVVRFRQDIIPATRQTSTRLANFSTVSRLAGQLNLPPVLKPPLR